MLNKKYMEFKACYEKAKYTVLTPTPLVFRIGEQPAKELEIVFKEVSVTHAAFITAWNPQSVLREQKLNDADQNRLQAELDEAKLPYLLGYGEDAKGAWKEDSFLIMGISQECACTIGKKYGQNAIVWLEIHKEPQLIFMTDKT